MSIALNEPIFSPPFFPEHAKDQQKERGSKDMYYKKDYSVFSTL